MADDDMGESDDRSTKEKVVDAAHFFAARESGFKGANEDALQVRLTLLLEEHSDLDAAITALALSPHSDGLAIARLKKKKLQLKDLIQKLKDQMTPDIIA
jgi:hypothetical protein